MSLLIIDLGGQYCHLIKRTFGDYHIAAEIRGPWVSIEQAKEYSGIILSGGPQSVNDTGSPSIDPAFLELGVPVLGICYGHQLLASMLGGTVCKTAPEYGPIKINFIDRHPLFTGLPTVMTVWMSHGDSVIRLSDHLKLNAISFDCPVVAFSDRLRRIYGVQFHPEVAHTEYGSTILKNFADLCGEKPHASVNRIDEIIGHIQQFVGDRKVLFFVSGGVDSTVAFALCAKALPKEQLLGAYVDTGYMRKTDSHDLMDCFNRLGYDDRILQIDRSAEAMTLLKSIVDPEEKRRIIGRIFVDVQRDILQQHVADDWLLGQGTIYPDVIESGPDGAATIKTHHNQCVEVQEMIQQGRVIEPLRELYKDQVRDIGHQLGIPRHFVEKWPFPGPGLAIRCLCSPTIGTLIPVLDEDYECYRLSLRSVGVQGDARAYRTTLAAHGPLDKQALTDLSHRYQHERIILHLGGKRELSNARVKRALMTRKRISMLREADYVVQNEMLGREGLVWQFPVVLIPLSFAGGESIVLRPVGSRDGMTANFVIPPHEILDGIVSRILEIRGIDAVFLDISDKPPATIEWE